MGRCPWAAAAPRGRGCLLFGFKWKPSTTACLVEVRSKKAPPCLDPELPTLFPTQANLYRFIAVQAADELEEELSRDDPLRASWFASCRLKYAGAWLAAIPSIPCFRVRSQLFRVMLCLRLLVEVPGTASIKRCVCGYAGNQLQTGVHWLSQCGKCAFTTVRHNAVLDDLYKMLKECGVATQRGETANWLARNRSVRPFDMVVTIDYKRHGYDVGIADATRLGKDRSVPYFQAGKAADLLLKEKQRDYQKKITEYGPLIKEVQFSPVINFRGSRGLWCKSAAALWRVAEARPGACEGHWPQPQLPPPRRLPPHMECHAVHGHVHANVVLHDCEVFCFRSPPGDRAR